MLIIYGNYAISWVLSGSGAPAPVALTNIANLNSGRSGDGVAFKWGGGAQTTSSNVILTGTIVDPLDTTAVLGGVGLVNIQGLPAGTLVDIVTGTYQQRLVAGRRGELNAWILPSATAFTNTIVIRIFNNVNGIASIPALQQFYIGQVIVGRLMSFPLMIQDNAPQEELSDPTSYQRSSGGQLWQLMRKPYNLISAQLGGAMTTTDAVGGTLSSIQSGGNPAGTIDARTVMYLLSTTPVCAVCAIPHKGPGQLPTTKTAGGFLYDVNMIQQNFMLARPTSLQPLQMNKAPYWSFAAQFQEAT